MRSVAARMPAGLARCRGAWPWPWRRPCWRACGGGDDGGDAVSPPAACSVADQQQWLRRLHGRLVLLVPAVAAPRSRGAMPTSTSYFEALLYTGSDPAFPADRWSRSESTESFNRFFGEGQHAGLRRLGGRAGGRRASPTQPLYVRHVEPLSPAAAQGVQRGDEVLAIERPQRGRPHRGRRLLGAHAPTEAGERLTLELRTQRRASAPSPLSAAVFTLTPVSGTAVLTTPAGRKLGYVAVKDMIEPGAGAAGRRAFARFKAEGVRRRGARPALQRRRAGLHRRHAGLVRRRHPRQRPPLSPRCSTTTSSSRQQPELPLLDADVGAGPAAGLRADGPAHLLGQRAGHQRPARRRYRRGGDRRDHLRQAGGLRCPSSACGTHLQRRSTSRA